MKYSLATIVTLLLLGLAAQGYSQSLGELAKKEKERREKVKEQSTVITNNDTSKYRSGPVTTGSPASTPAQQKPEGDKTGAQASAPGATKANPDEPVDFQGRTESWWRQTMEDARKKVKDLENEANVITLKIADMQNQFYRESDGYRQQQISRDLQKTFYEQDLNKQNLAKAKAELTDLESDGRKSGALPGWLTGKNP